MGSAKKERVPLRVGQVRELASKSERAVKMSRPAVIVMLSQAYLAGTTDSGSARIAMPDGSRERDKWVYDLLRCPVLAESVVEWAKQGEPRDVLAAFGVKVVSLNAPQPSPKPGGVAVWPLLIESLRRRHASEVVLKDMAERDAAGRAKYGMPLTVDNGRDHLVDAFQELMDASVYLCAAVMQSDNADVAALAERTNDLVVATRSVLFNRDGR